MSKQIGLLLLALLGVWSCTSNPPVEDNEGLSLAGTHWNSHFYYYYHAYHFATDTSGSADFGTLAGFLPIPPSDDNPPHAILYEDPRAFTYDLLDTTLIISYTEPVARGEYLVDTFDWDAADSTWIGRHAYAYGREYLFEGPRLEVDSSYMDLGE